MNITITGTSSGVGKALSEELKNKFHNVLCLDRNSLDLSNIDEIMKYNMPQCDMLINCAGTDIGGKTLFTEHNQENILTILNTNLISSVLLTRKALKNNSNCKIVNITSTNNNRYYQNNLAYSLSKLALTNFNDMLRVEYPDIELLEIRLGLTKTNFNNNRYKNNTEKFIDIYQLYRHLTVKDVIDKILPVLFDNTIKFIEVSP